MLPQENFVKLDPQRSLLRPFLGPKSYSSYSEQNFKIVATRLLCEVQIARNLDWSRSNVLPEVKCPGGQVTPK